MAGRVRLLARASNAGARSPTWLAFTARELRIAKRLKNWTLVEKEDMEVNEGDE